VCLCLSVCSATEVTDCWKLERRNIYCHKVNSVTTGTNSVSIAIAAVIQKFKYRPFVIGNHKRNF